MGFPVKKTETPKPSLMWFFVSLGILLFVSSMVPSLHSRTKHFITGKIPKEAPDKRKLALTPAAKPPKPSPTPPAKPATSPTPKPTPPAPPHH